MKDDEKKLPEEAEAVEEKPEETPPEAETPVEEVPEAVPEPPEEAPPEPAESSEVEELRVENIRLKTQLEAMKTGFSAEYIEDAVTLAEALAKRDGTDISEALNAVGKKYPDWKSGEKKGFKVGGDSSEKKPKTDESRLSAAFGIKRRASAGSFAL